MKSSLVFFGNERLATAVTTKGLVLKALIAAGYDIKAVIASHEDSISRQKHDLEIGPLAQRHGIPVILAGKAERLSEKVAHHPADLGVVVAFGRIIPPEVIDSFPLGAINLHPSLLPIYRGPTPIEQAILDGAAKTGVSIMQLSQAMDAGPIYAQTEINLTGQESKQALADLADQIGADLICRVIEQITAGAVDPKPQDDSQAVYCKKISKADGRIDWTKPAQQLERKIRAFLGWPGSYTNLFGTDVIITKAHAVPVTDPAKEPGDVEAIKDNGILTVQCGQGYLCIEQLKPAGKREMTAKEFLAGRRH